MILLAVLLAAHLQYCGVSVSTGEPVFMPYTPTAQVVASPEGQALIERREAERATVRAAVALVTAAGTSSPTLPPVTHHIAWRESVERWRLLVDRYFTGAGETEHALAIIRCESVGDPDAFNPAGPVSGLFQHRDIYWAARSAAAGWAGASIFDPEANIAVAAWLVHEGGGWRHWSGAAWGVDSCEEYAEAQGVG